MLSIALQKFSIALFLVLFIASSAHAQEKNANLMTYDEYVKVRHSYPYIVELRLSNGALL